MPFFAFSLCMLSPAVLSGAGFHPFFEPVSPPRRVGVMVHRGLAAAAPENTRRAIEMCIEDYCEWVEVDVRLTRDGRHVLFHDERLDRASDGTGLLAERSLDELLTLDAGRWFAPRFAGTRLLTLADGLALAKGRINLYLDCKRIDPALLVAEIRAAGVERQVLVFAEAAVIAQVRARSAGAVPVMAKWRPGLGPPERFAREHGLSAVEIDAPDVRPEVCRAYHEAGVKVAAKVLGAEWDVPDVWARVADAGADWLQTDQPLAVLAGLFRRRCPVWPVKVALHRGANRYAPENTLPAIRRAVDFGADYIEIDVHTAQDGGLLLMHDRTLDRTTDGSGPVADQTAEQVRRLDAGSWFGKPYAKTPVPSLEEALDAMGSKAHVYLDAKAITPARLAEVLNARGLAERSVVYQTVAYLRELKRLAPGARVLPPLGGKADWPEVEAIRPYGVDADWAILSKELIDRCHQRGIKVFSDALGAQENVPAYRRAIEWGLDVIQTDHPARVLRAVELHVAEHGPPTGR